MVESEKNSQEQNSWLLEKLIKNEVAFDFKFEVAVESFYQLVFNKINDKTNSLNSELRSIKSQLQHQESEYSLEFKQRGKTKYFYNVDIAKVLVV